jgi:hypothetical protein
LVSAGREGRVREKKNAKADSWLIGKKKTPGPFAPYLLHNGKVKLPLWSK